MGDVQREKIDFYDQRQSEGEPKEEQAVTQVVKPPVEIRNEQAHEVHQQPTS